MRPPISSVPALVSKMMGRRTNRGRVERMDGRCIIGWATDPKAPTMPVEVTLAVDGKPRTIVRADKPRGDVAAVGAGPERCGFEVMLPDDLPDGAPHKLSILLPDGTALPGLALRTEAIAAPDAPAARSKAAPASTLQVDGFVERIGPVDVSGWVVDKTDPDHMMDVCLRVDGKPVLSASADLERHDVHASGQKRLHCGFQFALPDMVFDGRPHTIEVVEVITGRVLVNGQSTMTARLEGVAFLNAGACAISGWVRPAASVSVRFDGGEAISHPANLPVAGLGLTESGFEIAIPAEFIDGTWHKAEVFYPNSDIALDNSPVSFRLDPAWRPVARNARLVGRRFQAEITDPSGAPASVVVEVEIDETPFDASRSFGRAGADGRRTVEMLSFALPPQAWHIALFHTDTEGTRTSLGQWMVDANGLHVPDAFDLGVEVSPRKLDSQALRDGAAAAHAAFCDPKGTPDPLFDPQWYGLTYLARDDAEHASALAHYRTEGALAGHSPSPLFDEEGARVLYPALAQAIAAGQFPSALSLYLHLGRGMSLHPLAGVDLPALLRAATIPDLPVADLHRIAPEGPADVTLLPDMPLPPRTWQMHASQSAYAAWMDRLNINDTMRDALHADEETARNHVSATRLHRRPLVSIIMPTFNRAHTIGDAIQSALDQTYPEFELLICDDASQDKTSEVIKQFDDPRIRYMQFTKSNGAETRNKGLRYARGQYLAYLDSDNLWHPLFLDMMMRQLLDAPGTSIAYSAYLDTETIGAGVELAALARPTFRPVTLSTKNFMDLNTIVHHRRIYDWLEGFDPTLPRLQDWDLMLRYTSVFRPRFVDHALVYYRRNVAWGQVTNLFMNSGAQDFVRRKTQRRLEEAHVHLAIDWPARPRVTIVAADRPGSVALAVDMAGLAAQFADVDLFADAPDGPLPDAVTRSGPSVGDRRVHTVAAHIAARGDGALTVCVGLSDADCATLQDMAPTGQVFTADHAADGIGLRLISDPRHRHHLGTLSFGGKAAALPNRRMTVLFPTDADRPQHADIAKSARAGGMALMIPPAGMESGDWLLFPDTGKAPARLPFAEGLAQATRGLVAVASAVPLEDLTVAEYALFTMLQGCEVPIAVVPSPHADDLLDARCAYRIVRPTPSWIAEKLSKLLQSDDGPKYAIAAMKAWRINLHPELVQGRLASFVHAVEYERAAPEVTHVER